LTKPTIPKKTIVRGSNATQPRQQSSIQRKSESGRREYSARIAKALDNGSGIRSGHIYRSDGSTHVARDKAPLAEREAAVLAGEQAADQREDKADRRQDIADQRQDTADLRQETADLRQEAADLRQDAADQSDQAARAN